MMVDEQQRQELATTLLERNLVKTREEALTLAAKFLEMDSSREEPVAVAGDALESAAAAEQAYASVLYYERLRLEPTGANPFTNARIEPRAQAPRAAPVAQSTPRERPSVDLSQMFNVANMRKAQES